MSNDADDSPVIRLFQPEEGPADLAVEDTPDLSEAQGAIIRILEDALVKARAGDLLGAALVVEEGDSFTTVYVNDDASSVALLHLGLTHLILRVQDEAFGATEVFYDD